MPHRLVLLLILCLIPLCACAQPADEPPAISEACAEPAFRAFDFWIGRWVVRDSTGTQVGTSHISRIAGGCGIREEWAGSSGSRGTSLNYYDAADGAWHQDWVGSGGLILHLSGGLDSGAMVLTGERFSDEGPVIDRIRWRALPDGRVRQAWTMSTDGGATWRQAFVGFYEAAPGGP